MTPASSSAAWTQPSLLSCTEWAGTTSGELYAYKPFKKLLKVFVPDCMFHYGMDKPLDAALDQLFQGSPYPVQIADNRYLTVYGKDGPYLYGRAFLWVDLQEGIALGAFYFRPTNGEPTPALNVFSREVKDEQLLSPTQLPPAFITALASWSQFTSLPPLMSRYFLTGSNKKILLEHDENLCANSDGSDPLTPEDCGLFNRQRCRHRPDGGRLPRRHPSCHQRHSLDGLRAKIRPGSRREALPAPRWATPWHAASA